MIDLQRREENDLILFEILNAKKSIEKVFEKLLHDITLIKFSQYQINQNIHTERRDDSSELNQSEQNIKTESVLLNAEKNSSQKRKKSKTTKRDKICFRCEKKLKTHIDLRIHLIKHKYSQNKKSSAQKAKSSSENNKTKNNIINDNLSLQKVNNIKNHFDCQQCQKSFKTLFGLKNHQKLHTGETFKCDQCEKETTSLGNLKVHKLIHTGEKPFACDQCKMKFKLKHHLAAHKDTHSNEKRFPCHQCEKKFKRKGVLTIHMKRIHLGQKKIRPKFRRARGVKQYACDLCEKKFTRNYYLNVHKRTHSENKS